MEGDIVKLMHGDLSITFEKNVLKEISIIDSGNSSVLLDNLDIFGDDSILKKLEALSSRIDKYGFIIFNDLGLALSGFIEDEGQRTITVYSENYWDDLLN